MKANFEVPDQGLFEKLGDALMVPLMYLISGTFREMSQRTHRWNNRKFPSSYGERLDSSLLLRFSGVEGSLISFRGVRFHIPIFGGWKDYVVIRPTDDLTWHIGWKTGGVICVSHIRLSGPVRMLLGFGDVIYFGVSADTYQQIAIQKIGAGKVGSGGRFAKLPLL